jgi:hypothetical protein
MAPSTSEQTPSPDGGRAPSVLPRGADAGAPGAPAPSGAGVTINGAFVPRERVVVFLHIGHSNMAGRATGPAAEKPLFYEKHPQLWSFRDKKWTQASEPTAPDHETGKSAGPGTALLKAALALAPTKHFVSIGFGMSGSTGGYCASFKKGGLFYDKVMGPALALKGNVTFGALFTMLGLTDRKPDPGKIQVGLSDCLKQVADDFRRDLGEPELPVIMSDYEMEARGGTYTPTGELAQVIIKELRLAAMKIPRSLLVPTEMLPMEDNHHFNLTGHRLWTERAMKLVTGNGWAPWAMK